MKGFGNDPSTLLTGYNQNDPYSSSLESTSTTTSSASVWSAVCSQSSNGSSPTSSSTDLDSSDSYATSNNPAPRYQPVPKTSETWAAKQAAVLPAEHRQNPRRTSGGASRGVPVLARESDRKVNFVDNLVDSATQIVEAIWPLSSVVCRNEMGSKAVLPLRTFIQETLRRSRTSYSTLQVALYYLVLIKPHLPNRDFTMEQTDDWHECRALQCGRRMFLSALILASKYLQDRNYSSRAWSRISGLATQEINQNELAFLLTVNWDLHITDEVFQRWTEIVLKYTPPPPPPPGASSALYVEQIAQWKSVILELTPGLDNVEGLIPTASVATKPWDRSALCSRGISSARRQSTRTGVGSPASESTPTPRSCVTPNTMEPSPATAYTPGRHAPALGLLPTPRLTPQSNGYNTPAASAATHLLGKASAMGYAMAQASNTNAAQALDRWPAPVTSSPQVYLARRSSLANTVSTPSSPESMVSDTSRTSRSSSISSASSLASAPAHQQGVPARFRCAKLVSEKAGLRPAIPEDYEDGVTTSSPESYTGSVGKLGDLSLETPLGRRERELDENDAAQALESLQNCRHVTGVRPPASLGRKRSHPEYLGNQPLQENVRGMLSRSHTSWPDTLVRSRDTKGEWESPRKRVCCSAEAAAGSEAVSLHPPTGGYRGPGMWQGILN